MPVKRIRFLVTNGHTDTIKPDDAEFVRTFEYLAGPILICVGGLRKAASRPGFDSTPEALGALTNLL
jgi:hypothetical protein